MAKSAHDKWVEEQLYKMGYTINGTKISAVQAREKEYWDKQAKGESVYQDDIAPVTSTVGRLGSNEIGPFDFFQRPDVYDEGFNPLTSTKSALGTAGDIGLNILKGVGGLVEGVTDLTAYGGAYLADAFGEDDIASRLRRGAQTNRIEEWTSGADEFLDKYSILGRTSDAVAQGVGQVGSIILTGGMGAAAGLGATGVTALTTGVMGLSGMGSGMSEAYSEGATDEEALKYGVAAGAADAVTELLFGGLGKGLNALGFNRGAVPLDDMAAQALSKFVKSQTGKNIVEFAVKSGFEGLEEVLAGGIQALAKKGTFRSEDDLWDIFKDENLFEQFIVGAFTSGISQTSGLNIANKSNTDFITGRTQNEQAVVDREVEKRIAASEKNGRKLTTEEKTIIQKQVESDLEKGGISIGTIEEVLGGDALSGYDSLQKEADEFKTLYDTESGKLSARQQDRLAELRAKNDASPYETVLKDMRGRISQDVFKQAQQDRLVESYLESDRRKQKFQADLSKYTNPHARQTVQTLMEQGIANNSYRMHELADTAARIAEDQGRVVRFTNNQLLKESGVHNFTKKFTADGSTTVFELGKTRIDEDFAPIVMVGSEQVDNFTVDYEKGTITFDSAPAEGSISIEYRKTGSINGFYNKKTGEITINVQSPRYWEFTVGHEVTHSLEQAKAYQALKKAVFQYAKNKGEYQSRYDALKNAYNEGTDIESELVADLVGDYIFSDYGFAAELSAKDQNVFQKVFSTIKHLAKLVTAGSKEARQLEIAKRNFEEAYRETAKAQKNTVVEDGVRYSLANIEDVTPSEEQKARNVQDVAKMESVYTVDSSKLVPGEKSIKETYQDFFAEWGGNIHSDVFGDIAVKNSSIRSEMRHGSTPVKVAAIEAIPSVIQNGKIVEWIQKSSDLFRVVVAAPIKIGSTPYYMGVMLQRDSQNQRLYLHDVVIEKEASDISQEHLDSTGPYEANENLYTSSILDRIVEVKRKLGLQASSDSVIDNISDEQNAQGLDAPGEVQFSLSRDAEFSDKAVANAENMTQQLAPTHSITTDTEAPYYGPYSRPADRLAYEPAPVQEVGVAENATVSKKEMVEMFPDDLVPAEAELESLVQERAELESRMQDAFNEGDDEALESIGERYSEVMERISSLESEIADTDHARMDSIVDADAPPESEAPYYGETAAPESPLADRDIREVGQRIIKAYMYENPEVKPFFQEEALGMLGDLHESVRGEKWFNDEVYYESSGEAGWGGTKRQTTDDIAELLDTWGYTYAQIEKGLNAIIEDNGAENNAVSKRIEFMLDNRLRNGYTSVWGEQMPANQDYIAMLTEKQVTEYSQEAFDSFMANADQYAPPADEDIAPFETVRTDSMKGVIRGQETYITTEDRLRNRRKQPGIDVQKAPNSVLEGQKAMWADIEKEFEAITPRGKSGGRMVRRGTTEQEKVAQILAEEPTTRNRKSRAWARFKANVFDKGAVFEDLSLKTRNRELMAKWNYTLSSEARAQRLMGNGATGVKSLNAIREEVANSGKTQEFYEYLYHRHNVDRMQLADRYEGTPNKPVFGYTVTADQSQAIVNQYERSNPAFRQYAEDVYGYMNHLRSLLVDNGVISQETADLWAEMYPHYVPIRRADDTGLAVNVPLDTRKTGVNAPVKRATGGNKDILPLFDTMAQRTIQTYKAIAKNSFGVELKNALGSTVAKESSSVDDVDTTIDNQEGLLQKGKNGGNPTFTVFENGERVTFEITEDMYDALSPVSGILADTYKPANFVSNFHRGLLTEYNPVFMLTNAIKDTQDILINSQHPMRTYSKLPEAFAQLVKKGYWYTEYMESGGEQNTYFDNDAISFDTERKGISKLVDTPPFSTISALNNFIEMTPRLAEYIASREAGQSVEVSMLDAARVTTNFAAGGDLTKFLNRNGATFLNASVQGLMQNFRNFREAKANGWMGWANLATKFALAGLPAALLNGLLWDDDDEYEELSDYVKQNYYVVWKTDDGKFIRIPKGRTLAVIQNAFEQIGNLVTGNDEADMRSFLELVVSNLAPNNPVEDNILAPVIQVWKNKTWYGEDLVPTRLQDLPAAEQYDESTDAFSKWLGDKLDISPVKINYLLDQYSGGMGDTLLPMLTPEAESGDNTFLGNMLAPLKSKFSTDSVLNNQNVSDFYDTMDELTTNAKSSVATDEDILKSKYMNSVNSELSELYAQKREIQNSDLPADVKYERVRQTQQEIVDLMKEGLDAYSNISFDGDYAIVGDRYFVKDEDGEWQKLSDDQVTKYKVTSAAGDAPYATDGETHYRWYVKEGESEGEWRKITDDQLEKQEEVTRSLDITPEEYWGNKEEYDYAYENPESYAVAKAVGGYDSFRQYSSELYDIKADKDKWGKSISGSRKAKVQAYISGLDADYYTKLILYKSEYTSYDDKNGEIIEYVNGLNSLTFDEKLALLRKLDFKVDSEGNVWWN